MKGVYPVSCLACTGLRRAPHPFELAAQDVADLVCLSVPVGDAFRPLFKVVLIVAPVHIECPVVQLHDRVADLVEEISVVGHHQQGASGAGKEAFEEFDGVYVEVVGRLVHDEEVSLGCQHFRQGHPLDFPA